MLVLSYNKSDLIMTTKNTNINSSPDDVYSSNLRKNINQYLPKDQYETYSQQYLEYLE